MRTSVGDRTKRYFFVVEGPEELHDDHFGTLLPNDDAALAYAKRIIRELKDAGGYDDPRLKMIVQNAQRQAIFALTFTTQAVGADSDQPRRPFPERN